MTLGGFDVVRRMVSGRLVAGAMAVTMVASTMWAVTAAVLAEPATAAVGEPSTYRYDPEYPPGFFDFQPGDHAVSMSEDALSVGFLNDPVLPTFARTTM